MSARQRRLLIFSPLPRVACDKTNKKPCALAQGVVCVGLAGAAVFDEESPFVAPLAPVGIKGPPHSNGGLFVAWVGGRQMPVVLWRGFFGFVVIRVDGRALLCAHF